MSRTAHDILGDLVAFPTVAGTPNEELVAYAAQRLADAGAAVTVFAAHRDHGRHEGIRRGGARGHRRHQG